MGSSELYAHTVGEGKGKDEVGRRATMIRRGRKATMI
jgi:hypothetical protein